MAPLATLLLLTAALLGRAVAQTATSSASSSASASTTAAASPSATASASPSTTAASTATASGSAASTPTGSGTAASTPSTSPTASQTATKSATATGTATTTHTPSAPPTPSPYSPVAFAPGNIVVLRLGDSSYNASAAAVGFPMPVYLDEVSATTGTLVRTIPLPFATCALGTGKPTAAPFWWYDTDGWPQLSDNGQVRSLAGRGDTPGGWRERHRPAYS